MISFILAELLVAAGPAPLALLQAQAAVQAEVPKTRKVCRDVLGGYTRTPKRVCTTVAVQPPAARQAPPAPVATTLSVGMVVVDTQGGTVATITALAPDTVTVKTAKHEAQLPRTSLTVSEGKALFGLTQAALDASIERTLATAPRAELKVGATVKATGGTSVGTIDSVEADNVTISLSGGTRVVIPRSSIAVDADGSGHLGLSAAELNAQVKATQPSR